MQRAGVLDLGVVHGRAGQVLSYGLGWKLRQTRSMPTDLTICK